MELKFNIGDIVNIKEGYGLSEDREGNPFRVTQITIRKYNEICYALESLTKRMWTGFLEEALELHDDTSSTETPQSLFALIKPHLSKETAHDPNTWTAENPTKGHCAIVAAIIQIFFGGDLVSIKIEGHSHWFNRIDGCYYDFTRDQYPGKSILVNQSLSIEDWSMCRTRSIQEFNLDTMKRFALLFHKTFPAHSYQ